MLPGPTFWILWAFCANVPGLDILRHCSFVRSYSFWCSLHSRLWYLGPLSAMQTVFHLGSKKCPPKPVWPNTKSREILGHLGDNRGVDGQRRFSHPLELECYCRYLCPSLSLGAHVWQWNEGNCLKWHSNLVLFKKHPSLHPTSAMGVIVVCEIVYVCECVTILPAERTDIRTWILACRSSGRKCRSSLKVKAKGQGHQVKERFSLCRQ